MYFLFACTTNAVPLYCAAIISGILPARASGTCITLPPGDETKRPVKAKNIHKWRPGSKAAARFLRNHESHGTCQFTTTRGSRASRPRDAFFLYLRHYVAAQFGHALSLRAGGHSDRRSGMVARRIAPRGGDRDRARNININYRLVHRPRRLRNCNKLILSRICASNH